MFPVSNLSLMDNSSSYSEDTTTITHYYYTHVLVDMYKEEDREINFFLHYTENGSTTDSTSDTSCKEVFSITKINMSSTSWIPTIVRIKGRFTIISTQDLALRCIEVDL